METCPGDGPDPSRIMQVARGYWESKTLLSAVELGLFTLLGKDAMTGAQIGERLGLHPRAIYDFLDALVALRFLERDGDGADGRYRNAVETATFLDSRSPRYIGDLLAMSSSGKIDLSGSDVLDPCALGVGRPGWCPLAGDVRRWRYPELDRRK